MGEKLVVIDGDERLVAALTTPSLRLAANPVPPFVRAARRVASATASSVLPPQGEHVAAADKEVSKEVELRGWRVKITRAARFLELARGAQAV
jgi:hypothetical protein